MGKRKSRLGDDVSPEAQVDFLISEANKNLEKGNYGSAEFKATEALSSAKNLLGFEHPLTGRANVCAATIFISSQKIGKARPLLDSALEIADNCEDHALKALAFGGLAEVAMRDPNGKKTERAKLSQEYWRLQREEEERAKKFPAKPPPPVTPAADDEDDYFQEGASTKKSQKTKAREPVGRDKEWALLKQRKDAEREAQERELELEEERYGPRPPADLSQYTELPGGDGWTKSPCRKWLYHEGSNVFLQQSSGRYFRKGVVEGEYEEVKQQQQEVVKEEPVQVIELLGTVKTVIPHKGYGFIKPDSGEKDVWVKLGLMDLKEGMRVRFKMGRVDERDCGIDIVILEVPKPKPAPVAEAEPSLLDSRRKSEERAPIFDIWGRAVEQKEDLKLEKEEKPAWDKEVKSGIELLRGHQLVMEDYATRDQLGSLGTMFAVFDGHGGREASEFCFNKFGLYVENEFRKKFPLELLTEKRVNPYQVLAEARCPAQAPVSYLSEVITNGFLAADAAFLEATKPTEGVQRVRAGTTANVCFLRGPSRDKLQLITANAGDSRAVLCRAGKAIRLSEDHKPDRKDEKQRIEESGGSVLLIGNSWRCTKGKEWGSTRFKMPEDQLLLACSRSLGDRELKEASVVSARPEITVENICEDDFFVILASDGVWDVLEDQEACDLAIKYFNHGPEAMAKIVCQEAIKKDSHDNTSAQVIQFAWNGDRIKACLKDKKEKKKKEKAKVVDMFGSDDD